jgi:glutamine amidotransferase
MCQLLGLNFNKPVRASLSFRGFTHRGNFNPHGWGLARYEGKACQIFKEPLTATNSSLATFVRDYEQFRSTIFIGHVRLASRGSYSIQNTHPFTRPFRSRDIVLAHNGTLHGALSRNGLKFHPVGETDSEHILCFMLTKLSEQRTRFINYQEIESLLQQVNRHGTMNLLFSESEHLFCYRDQAGYNGMCMTSRHEPYRRVRLLDEDWEGDLDLEKESGHKGVIVATSKLTDEVWTDLPSGRLTVFSKGEQVY